MRGESEIQYVRVCAFNLQEAAVVGWAVVDWIDYFTWIRSTRSKLIYIPVPYQVALHSVDFKDWHPPAAAERSLKSSIIYGSILYFYMDSSGNSPIFPNFPPKKCRSSFCSALLLVISGLFSGVLQIILFSVWRAEIKEETQGVQCQKKSKKQFFPLHTEMHCGLWGVEDEGRDLSWHKHGIKSGRNH